MLDRDDSPGEDRRKLIQFFGRISWYRALTRINRPGCSKEPHDAHYERKAHHSLRVRSVDTIPDDLQPLSYSFSVSPG